MYIIMGVHNYLQWNCHLERSTHWQTVCVETICKTLLLSLILVSCVSILVLPTPCPSPSHSPHSPFRWGWTWERTSFREGGCSGEMKEKEGDIITPDWPIENKYQAPKKKLWLLNIKWIYVCCYLRSCFFRKELRFRAICSLTNSLCRNHKQNAIVFFELNIVRFHPCDRMVYVNSFDYMF